MQHSTGSPLVEIRQEQQQGALNGRRERRGGRGQSNGREMWGCKYRVEKGESAVYSLREYSKKEEKRRRVELKGRRGHSELAGE